MELRQLAIFAAAAEERSLSAAARRLYLSHSTVSRAMSELERELGVRLLERDTHTMKLTAAGERLYAEATEILARIDGLAERIKGTECRSPSQGNAVSLTKRP